MNETERDELLIRMDERQKAIYTITLNQETHLAKLNSKVADHVLKIAFNQEKISNIEKFIENGIPVRFTKKQYTAAGISAMTLISTLIIAVGKMIGWF